MDEAHDKMRWRSLTTLTTLLCMGAVVACDRSDNAGGGAPEQAEGQGEAKADAAPGDSKATADSGDDAGPASTATCATAAANLVQLMKPEVEKQLQQVPEEHRAQAEQQMKAQLDPAVIAAQCEQQKPDQAELACVTEAKSPQDLEKCQPPPQAGGTPPPGHGAPPPSDPSDGAAAPSAGDSA